MEEITTNNNLSEDIESVSVQTGQSDSGDVREQRIPDELAGITPEIAREIMQEAASQAGENQSDADADSDNKQVKDESEPVLEPTNQKIPYARFKAELDKRKALEAEIEKMKSTPQQPSGYQAHPMPQYQSQPSQRPPAPPQSPVVSTEIANEIEQAISQQAMAMTGLSKEDVEALEYAEEGSAKVAQWKAALGLARSSVYNAIVAESQKRQQAHANLARQMQESVALYQSIVERESKEPDIADIQNFAQNEYFSTLSPVEQRIVGDSYFRTENRTASPQDIFCVIRYYENAKAAWRAQHPVTAQAATKESAGNKNIVKPAQTLKHPRSEQVRGVATSDDGKLTVEKLQNMMETMRWEDIPESARRALISGKLT